MTIFFLVRHAVHGLVEHVLLGRTGSAALNEQGRLQAQRVADCLCAQRITAIQSSPQLRSRQTAGPLAERAGLPVEIASAIDEIDVGTWSGRSFVQLKDDPLWHLWNAARGSARPPRGESMAELQKRVVEHLYCAHAANPGGRMVLFSHAEPIRAALLHVLKRPLDDFAQVAVDPAAISTIAIGPRGATLLALNRKVAS